jgi:predicted PurR-regulated permease PerM
MSVSAKAECELEEHIASRAMDVFVRIGLVLVLALPGYRALSPFLTLLIWLLILAVALYPLHDAVARNVGGRHGRAATLVAILGLALIVAPSAVLMSSLGDSVHQFICDVQSNSLEIPAPAASVAHWPVVGPARGEELAKLSAATVRAVAQAPSLHSLTRF